MKKYTNARKVTFKESYGRRKDGSPIFKKGRVTAMDVNAAEKLKKKGANISIETLDIKAIEERKRDANAKAKRAAMTTA